GLYCLYLTGEQARATLRALGHVAVDDADAAAVQARLQRLVQPRQVKQRTEEEDREARKQMRPPYDLPDAEALQGFAAPGRRRRGPNQT
ncbi:hypothetical protein ACFU6S_44390, partial [Streptomyces sp. NPDC057456]|uniref:hypothetical protein n=1 Tax=Streptomyces sp. NPDC057456 TaxID=3346139 RepID=UPI0036A499A1